LGGAVTQLALVVDTPGPQGAVLLERQRVGRNQKGKAVMDFKGIPVEQLLLLAEALTAEPPTASPGPQGPLPVQPS